MRNNIEKENIAFDPEEIELLVRAFNDCWKSVQQSGADMNDESARDALARCIVESALKGERDPQRLSQFAASRLSQATGSPPQPRAEKPIE